MVLSAFAADHSSTAQINAMTRGSLTWKNKGNSLQHEWLPEHTDKNKRYAHAVEVRNGVLWALYRWQQQSKVIEQGKAAGRQPRAAAVRSYAALRRTPGLQVMAEHWWQLFPIE